MDRNLGARSAKREDGLMFNAGFGYQYGRKDPYPMVLGYTIYNSRGEKVLFDPNPKDDRIKPLRVEVESAFMYQSVWNPFTFYATTASAYPDWVKHENFLENIWNDIEGKKSGKSFFDPCPPGWRIPMHGTWEIINTNTYIEDSWRSGPTLGWDVYMGEIGKSETVFFPIAGWRNLTNGYIGLNQSTETSDYIFTRLWNSNPSTPSSSDANYIKKASYAHLGRDNTFKPTLSSKQINYKAYANNVRCIQE